MTNGPTIVFPGDRGLLTPDFRAVVVLGLYMDTHGTWLRVEDEETHLREVVMALRVVPIPDEDEPVDISEMDISIRNAEAEDFRICGASYPMERK
jgi:hypothetical protein